MRGVAVPIPALLSDLGFPPTLATPRFILADILADAVFQRVANVLVFCAVVSSSTAFLLVMLRNVAAARAPKHTHKRIHEQQMSDVPPTRRHPYKDTDRKELEGSKGHSPILLHVDGAT